MTDEEIDSFKIGDIIIIDYPLSERKLKGTIVERDGFCTFYVNFGENKNYPINFCTHKVTLVNSASC